ncbi:Uncharacterized protein ycf45 [Vitis vinifera]|uniref:Uncharacterized protein ycf45 n=1 Tax=Vitis vinifera TaxID=29760 RepID=A0A438J4H6_VITVI|nr:Uncharacterized protein ycf45 [Vitis vinifera]
MLIFPLLRFSPPPLRLQRLPCQPLTPFSKFSPKLPYPTIHSSPFSSPLRILPAKFSGYPRKFPNSLLSSYLASASAGEDEFEVELDRLLALLPEEMRRRVSEHPELHQLIEVVMDLGRKPLARFPSGDFVLSDCPITVQDIKFATSQGKVMVAIIICGGLCVIVVLGKESFLALLFITEVPVASVATQNTTWKVGDFAIDNRAGISRTLHRISAIRNRKGAIIGLTCRVGRAISGSANLLQDLVKDGASLLLIGPPGVGKTTIIREVARMLANDYKKRVMIVDTSNEIGGDGDIPHAGIGNARRMQVPNSDMQHKVLIEAVENHMPQVIVIDEIGTKLEAMAASTIAQRGIQLVATAHGVTIENLIMNPSLEMLVGGIQSVTLGDEEASRRGVQKTVLERKGPSTFSCGVEIISKTELQVHPSLEATVDAILSGRFPHFEVRKINSQGVENKVQSEAFVHNSSDEKNEVVEDGLEMNEESSTLDELICEPPPDMGGSSAQDTSPVRVFAYGGEHGDYWFCFSP